VANLLLCGAFARQTRLRAGMFARLVRLLQLANQLLDGLNEFGLFSVRHFAASLQSNPIDRFDCIDLYLLYLMLLMMMSR
jgi:hypothetical protein